MSISSRPPAGLGLAQGRVGQRGRRGCYLGPSPRGTRSKVWVLSSDQPSEGSGPGEGQGTAHRWPASLVLTSPGEAGAAGRRQERGPSYQRSLGDRDKDSGEVGEGGPRGSRAGPNSAWAVWANSRFLPGSPTAPISISPSPAGRAVMGPVALRAAWTSSTCSA